MKNWFDWIIVAQWCNALLWWIACGVTWRGVRGQTPLPLASEIPAQPLVSILVPARDEAGRVLRASVASMLAQDYDNFEVIAVNDRSTDATGDILQAMAQSDKRLHVIAGTPTPAGWLGKPHALAQALDAARGAWILATDADMLFTPHALRTVLSHALRGGYDAVTLLPRVTCGSFWERVFLPAFGWFMLMAMPLSRVNDPQRKESTGVGGFFLLRREVLENLGGYAAVRADVAEDLRLGALLKASGARLRVEYGTDLVSTRMQTNFWDLWHGFTKNMFAGMQFRVAPTLAGGLSITLFAVLPTLLVLACTVLGLAGNAAAWGLWWPSAAVWLAQVSLFALINYSWDVPLRYALTVPLGFALFVAVLFNSAWRIVTRRGVNWKGRNIYGADGVRPPQFSKK